MFRIRKKNTISVLLGFAWKKMQKTISSNDPFKGLRGLGWGLAVNKRIYHTGVI